jgi:DNA-binding CsgD family transcriptional regulator
MAPTTDEPVLFSAAAGVPSGVVVINPRCRIQERDGYRVVSACGLPLSHFASGDRVGEAYAMVSLVELGWARQGEVARAFGCDVRTVRRHQRRFEEGGLAALGRPPGFPRGRPRVTPGRREAVNRWKAEGVSNREIARRLGIDEKAVRKLARRLGWPERSAQQSGIPFEGADPKLSGVADLSGAGARASGVEVAAADGSTADSNLSAPVGEPAPLPAPFSLDGDPADRSGDRLLARLGLLEDAAPLFGAATQVPGVGVLLAIPALVDSGVLTVAREIYTGLGAAFYGLRTTLVTLLLMALLRVKRPEGLKERSPRQLGQVLGLDRAPEVKTLRRKLARLAAQGRAAEFGRALARHRVAARGHVMGLLYVDGHVRAYHGAHEIPKTHVARMRISMPATTDYWVNDAEGEPLFVVPTEANRGLVERLPAVLEEVRKLVGDRRVTVVFDRGGWSPELFAQILDGGFDLLTYRKAPFRRLPHSRFAPTQATFDGRQIDYLLADQGIYLEYGRKKKRKRIHLRQVTRLSEDGHQTPVLTSRRDLSALEVAYRMFERWRQENFFKYLREEFALDALVDYGTEPADASREVPNPERKKIDAEIRQARARLEQIQAHYGLAALDNPERLRPTMRGFKIANASLSARVRAAMKHITELENKRTTIPASVPVQEVVQAEVVQLAVERKHLTDLLKMVAYQAEGDLLRLLAPHYKRTEHEGRTLVHSALSAGGDIEVTNDQLLVSINPLSSPHKTQALEKVCEQLNETATPFPGTDLRMRFAIKPEPSRSLAFPGPREPSTAPQPDISEGG